MYLFQCSINLYYLFVQGIYSLFKRQDYQRDMKKRTILSRFFIYLFVLLVLGLLGFPLAMLSGAKQGKVTLNEAISLPFAVKKENRVILLYFGYLGCQTICTPSLEEISSIYKEANLSKGLAFYSLLP